MTETGLMRDKKNCDRNPTQCCFILSTSPDHAKRREGKIKISFFFFFVDGAVKRDDSVVRRRAQQRRDLSVRAVFASRLTPADDLFSLLDNFVGKCWKTTREKTRILSRASLPFLHVSFPSMTKWRTRCCPWWWRQIPSGATGEITRGTLDVPGNAPLCVSIQ